MWLISELTWASYDISMELWNCRRRRRSFITKFCVYMCVIETQYAVTTPSSMDQLHAVILWCTEILLESRLIDWNMLLISTVMVWSHVKCPSICFKKITIFFLLPQNIFFFFFHFAKSCLRKKEPIKSIQITFLVTDISVSTTLRTNRPMSLPSIHP